MTANEARAEYLREWRKAHPEKTKAYARKYWENKAHKHDQQAGPLDSLARGLAAETERRKKTLTKTQDPEQRKALEAEIRHLEDLASRIDFVPQIETRGKEDKHHEDH